MLQSVPDPGHPRVADDLVVAEGDEAQGDVDQARQRYLEGQKPGAVPDARTRQKKRTST